jgi:uncharacterized coiled-coil DUF342 family protein
LRRFAGVAEPVRPTSQKREELREKLQELRLQSRRYLAEISRISEDVEKLQERLSELSPDAQARAGNAAGFPTEEHGAA